MDWTGWVVRLGLVEWGIWRRNREGLLAAGLELDIGGGQDGRRLMWSAGQMGVCVANRVWSNASESTEVRHTDIVQTGVLWVREIRLRTHVPIEKETSSSR